MEQVSSRHRTTGVLLLFDESRRADLIRDRPIEEEGFTDTLSVSDWNLRQVNVALLSFSESTVDYICLARKGRRVATLKNRVEISLDIFSRTTKLRGHVLSSWAPPDEAIQNPREEAPVAELSTAYRGCFLDGISPRYLSEEAAIQHDLFNWPGMSATHIAGRSIFEQGKRRLEVAYANRNRLEMTFGVDLIYYNSTFRAFVFVQYKLMKMEGGQAVYRPDSQLEAELQRMDNCYKSLRTPDEIRSHEDYRFNDDGFLLKFIPAGDLEPASRELVKGMYVPREYMHFLLGPNGPKGPRGGPRITFDDVPRYLTNSEFTINVGRGWIGTRAVRREDVREMVQRSYETQRAIMVAAENTTA